MREMSNAARITARHPSRTRKPVEGFRGGLPSSIIGATLRRSWGVFQAWPPCGLRSRSHAGRMRPAPPTILVVDDNPMVREVVQGMLNAAGFHALSAEDGATALALFATNQIDAAMIDVDMPGMKTS